MNAVDPNRDNMPTFPAAPSWSRGVPCVGRWDEFDSMDVTPGTAAAMCAGCPMIDRCHQEAALAETLPMEVVGVRAGLSARERMVALLPNKREKCGRGHTLDYMDPKSVRVTSTSGSASCQKCAAIGDRRRKTVAVNGARRAAA